MKSETEEQDASLLDSTDFIRQEKDHANKIEKTEEYTLYPYRWLMQFAFCMALASTGLI